MSQSSLHVAVLNGGISLEREISLRSGTRVADALGDLGHHVERLDVDAELVRTLTSRRPDVVFLALHGAAGEDGTVQAMLDLLQLPYTGPTALASSLAWNKPIAQGLYRRAGLHVPAGVAMSQQAFRELGAVGTVTRIVDALRLPVVVKPATGGSSLGLTRVSEAAGLPQAIVGALSYADGVLIEHAVEGVEVAVSVLDGRPLPPVEIVPLEGEYDFSARYTAGAVAFHAPARLPEDVLDACRDAATRAVATIGARHVSRADLIVDADGRPWVLELDTCPGLTDTSLLPTAATAEGMGFGALCERLLALALDDAP